ncbi:Bax inhibitor-1/YccA family protein [Candidatus Dependentiae bacterium]|nr:Bax inhibitor-1/YccA family protein [Candidatus Dependentiae bacterium]
MNYQNQDRYMTVAEGFMAKVYGWMCVGLALSAAVSYYIMSHPIIFGKIFSNMWMFLGIFVLSLGLIFAIGYGFARMSYGFVVACYLAFVVLQGVVITPILFKYTGTSVVSVFLITSLMFFGMALYGTFTKADLSSMGNILLMGLWGLIICGLVNFFLQSSLFETFISACGVGIFSLFIAYDVQMLRRLSQQMMMTNQDAGKFAVMGALNLYMNMLNLFISLLQLFGEEKKK